MKLLTITNETQGQRKNDFISANVGEIAHFGSTCDRGTVDDKCGCKRSMVGIDTAQSSTTVKVTDVAMSAEELTAKLANLYVRDWGMTVKEAMAIAHPEADELMRMGKQFDVGAILEIRGSNIKTRDTRKTYKVTVTIEALKFNQTLTFKADSTTHARKATMKLVNDPKGPLANKLNGAHVDVQVVEA